MSLLTDFNEVFIGKAWCVKCKDSVEFTGSVRTSDSGRKMAHGNCPRCNTKVNRILGKTWENPMSKKSKEKEELRDAGYMTPGEFVDALVPGLKDYLKHNWGCKPDELYHPEDLFSNAEIYLEVARHVAGDFIVRPKR